MCSDGRCNQLTWTPDVEGSFSFQLVATDDRGAEAELRWTVVVTEPGANNSPVFTSSPVTSAQVGEEYVYTARAQDPDGDDLVFSLAAASPVQMKLMRKPERSCGRRRRMISAPTRSWFKSVMGVEVICRPSRLRSSMSLPTIHRSTSEAITIAVAEVAYEYRIRANDPDEDDVGIFPKAGPGGMEVTPDEGLVTWLPPIEAVGQAVLVQVEVSDGEDNVLHEWIIEVQDNPDIAPIANAGLTAPSTLVGSNLTAAVVWTRWLRV